MVMIAISPEAFEAICATLPKGSVSYEKPIDEHGPRWIRFDRWMLDKLKSHRRAGERFSDVILRLARRATWRRSGLRERSWTSRLCGTGS